MKHRSRSGFTIVELLIVIVIIGILAVIVVVAYNGIQTRAENASLQSEASQAGKKVLAHKALNNDALPADMEAAGVTVSSDHDIYYRVTPDGNDFCLAVNITASPQRVYSVTSTNGVAKQGTCEGYILVPGNSTLDTGDFWVMKYEAKNVSGIATSQASSTPWASISQTSAISASAGACDGCRLISEAEWMTLAGDVLGVNSNWGGGSVGSGSVYSGHNDSSPNNAIAASSDDNDGYSNTGNTTGSNQRRTLTLTNGEVIWDIAGNLQESTQGTLAANATVGSNGESNCSWHEWTDSISWGTLSNSSRPSAISGTVGTYNASQGIGRICTHYSNSDIRSHSRGGAWTASGNAGVLAVYLGNTQSGAGSGLGFRVAR